MTRVGMLALATLWLWAGVVLGGAQPKANRAKPIEILQGEIAELQVASQGLSAVAGRFGRETIPFYRNGESTYAALLGIDLEAKPWHGHTGCQSHDR